METHYLSQAYYCIECANIILPEGKSKKCHANVFRQKANFHNLRLDLCTKLEWPSEEVLTKEVFKFTIGKMSQIKFTKINKLDSIEDVTNCFKITNTLYRKSMEYYILDGFAGDHIGIVACISKALGFVMLVDTNVARVISILRKRLDLLLPLTESLNRQ